MDVTILIAPAGSGTQPVRFLPKSHVISVPDDEEIAVQLVEDFTKRLVSQYSSRCYVWESVCATPGLMEKFRLYVQQQEESRLLLNRRTPQIVVRNQRFYIA